MTAEYCNELMNRAERIIEICRSIYPVKGLVVSPDIDRAFSELQRLVPELHVHSFASGLECEDWIVPQSWLALSGRLENEEGVVLASLAESFLFVAPFSEPVDGWFSKSEIAKRMRTRPEHPDAYVLEHRNAYDFRLRDWGITLPFSVWQSMPEDRRFRLVIETEVNDGALKVGEWILPGRRPEIICICSQFDELCNDGQSSAVLALDLMQKLAKQQTREFTYQLLLVPEMFGTVFYILNHAETVSRTIGIYNLETIGAGDKWILKASLETNGLLDRALELAFKETQIAFEFANFFQGYGNDERVFAWPTVGIPGTALQRYPYAHYHTSYDTPDDLQPTLIVEAIRISESVLNILENDYIPIFRGRAQPWLTRHGLYFDHYVNPEDFAKINNTVLFHTDGTRSISELAVLAGLAFTTLHKYFEKFYHAGLIDRQPLRIKSNLPRVH